MKVGLGMTKKKLKQWIMLNFIATYIMSFIEAFKMENTTKVFQFIVVTEFLTPIIWLLILCAQTSNSKYKKNIYLFFAVLLPFFSIASFFW